LTVLGYDYIWVSPHLFENGCQLPGQNIKTLVRLWVSVPTLEFVHFSSRLRAESAKRQIPGPKPRDLGMKTYKAL
jgi:hypothetical protein